METLQVFVRSLLIAIIICGVLELVRRAVND